jgi:hypothetical protein
MDENPYKAPTESGLHRDHRRLKLRLGELAAMTFFILAAACVGALALAGK